MNANEIKISEDTANINAIAELLLSAGPAFSGGSDESAMVAAREWDGCDFTAEGVRLWIAAEVWEPSVANELDAAGVNPRKLIAAVGSQMVYDACNGDVSVAKMIAAYSGENGKATSQDALRAAWDACESPVRRVLDEHGDNPENGKLRHLEGESYIYVDDVDGFSVLDGEVVKKLILS